MRPPSPRPHADCRRTIAFCSKMSRLPPGGLCCLNRSLMSWTNDEINPPSILDETGVRSSLGALHSARSVLQSKRNVIWPAPLMNFQLSDGWCLLQSLQNNRKILPRRVVRNIVASLRTWCRKASLHGFPAAYCAFFIHPQPIRCVPREISDTS